MVPVVVLPRHPMGIRPMALSKRPWCPSLSPIVPAVFLTALALWALASPAVGNADPQTDPGVEELRLETSDGIRIAAWYYPVAEGSKPIATVILVHDIEGTHKTVERLARSLQGAGYAVVAPDLRAHGASGSRGATEPRLLKKNDLEMIAAASGGTLRVQSTLKGEIEAVRNWIKGKSDDGVLDIDRLCVVGCGLSGTLASMWTAADSNWPPVATGPQGRHVRALVLISPVWATKGVSMSLPLTSDAIKQSVPVLVLAGTGDRDAIQLFDRLKRLRPRGWFEQRIGKEFEAGTDDKDPSKATAFFIQSDTRLAGDKLANDPEMNVVEPIKTFLTLALARPRD